MTDEKALFKINRAKIFFQRDFPFFSYLSFFLKPIEVKDAGDWEDGGFGMGIDIKGNLYYNPQFVNKQTEPEMTGILCHEILHLCLLHLIRDKGLNHIIANIAEDITINEIIKDNNFVIPKGAFWSNEDREVKVGNKIIKNCNSRVFEDIYWEIYDEIKKEIKEAIKRGEKFQVTDDEGEGIEIDLDGENYFVDGFDMQGKGKVKNFDTHIRGKKGKELTEEEKLQAEKEWTDRAITASQISRFAGKEIVGIERIIKGLHRSKVGWRQLLNRQVQNSFPNDFTWQKPNKKSISLGETYLPDTLKEKIEIGVMIDTSGSIGSEELADFLSEIVGIAKGYREKVKMNLAVHETKLISDWVVENGNIKKILDTTKIKGGGGTSFKEPYEEFIKKHKKTKLLIWFTDGAGDIILKKDLKCNIIWVIAKKGSDELVKGLGKVIKLN